MKDVQGNELSRHHHINSYWTDYGGSRTEEESLDATAAGGGQVMLCHPGRYEKDVAWYVDLYSRYDHLFGMEIYNQGDRYPDDRETWDEVLTETMPDRPVWGLSNDDMHRRGHLGRNWNVLLIEDATEATVRRALADGNFYFVYCPKGHTGAPAPEIQSVDVNQRAGTITIRSANTEKIEWISDGRVVGQGETLTLSEVEDLGSYVRAVLYGPEDDTLAGTQPFGILAPPAGAKGAAESE